jgi:hypothetical protein
MDFVGGQALHAGGMRNTHACCREGLPRLQLVAEGDVEKDGGAALGNRGIDGGRWRPV